MSKNSSSNRGGRRPTKLSPRQVSNKGRALAGVTMKPKRSRRATVASKLKTASEDLVAPLVPKEGSEMELSAEGRALLTNSEWIELFPLGISVSSAMGRPVLVLKDKHGVEVLPVWVQPLDAGVALAELSQSSGSTPHAVTRRLLQALDMKLESCTFVDLVGHHQYVMLKFDGHPEMKSLRLRADEAMSFCLQARARFYSTRAYMVRCRTMDEELARVEQSLLDGSLPGLQAEMEISSKKHPYMM